MAAEACVVEGKLADSSAELHPLIAARWSPRALDPEAEISDTQLRALLEAARWAASSGNTQPARYLVGRRGDDTYKRIFEVLRPGNKSWAGAASVLLLGVVVTEDDRGRSIPLGEYALGLSTQNLVLQASQEGLVTHQMGGFDKDAARAAFDLPATSHPVVVVAVGKLGDPEQLPDDLRERELAARSRKPLSEIAFAGEWGTPAL